jgi:hypothetical protein
VEGTHTREEEGEARRSCWMKGFARTACGAGKPEGGEVYGMCCRIAMGKVRREVKIRLRLE